MVLWKGIGNARVGVGVGVGVGIVGSVLVSTSFQA